MVRVCLCGWVFVLLAFWLFVFVVSCCVCDFARWLVGLRCCLVLVSDFLAVNVVLGVV